MNQGDAIGVGVTVLYSAIIRYFITVFLLNSHVILRTYDSNNINLQRLIKGVPVVKQTIRLLEYLTGILESNLTDHGMSGIIEL